MIEVLPGVLILLVILGLIFLANRGLPVLLRALIEASRNFSQFVEETLPALLDTIARAIRSFDISSAFDRAAILRIIRRLEANTSNSELNFTWLVKRLPEEYRAHFVDQRNEMIATGRPKRIIRRKLLCYWFLAALWTPFISILQRLIRPTRISN